MQRSRRVLEFIEDIIEEIEKSETGRTTGLGILEIYTFLVEANKSCGICPGVFLEGWGIVFN